MIYGINRINVILWISTAASTGFLYLCEKPLLPVVKLSELGFMGLTGLL
jgi:hypothetical protein